MRLIYVRGREPEVFYLGVRPEALTAIEYLASQLMPTSLQASERSESVSQLDSLLCLCGLQALTPNRTYHDNAQVLTKAQSLCAINLQCIAAIFLLL